MIIYTVVTVACCCLIITVCCLLFTFSMFTNLLNTLVVNFAVDVLFKYLCYLLHLIIYVYLVVYCSLNVPYLFVIYSFAAYLIILLVHLFCPSLL